MFATGDRILVVASHPDDEILGCGGTIKKISSSGIFVATLILSKGVKSRNKSCINANDKISNLISEATLANKILGVNELIFEDLPDNRFDSIDQLDIVKIIEKHVNNIRPKYIFTHFGDDLNIDHRITSFAVSVATRPIPKCGVLGVFRFPILSSTEWNFPSKFSPNLFVKIDDELMFKTEAMEAYASEIREWPHPRSVKMIETFALSQGSVIGCSAAECFEVSRLIF